MSALTRSVLSTSHRLLPVNLPNRLLAALAVSIVCIAPAFAGKYELIKGQGVEVCEAYGKNLNSIDQSYPMICGREINPKMKDLSRPAWVEPDLEQARALRFDLAKLMSRVRNRPEPKSEADMKVRIEEEQSWPIKRWISKVDIDNDGIMDSVLKQQDGDCPMHRAFSVTIAVLTDDGKHYDLEKSKYINADFSKRAAKLANDTKPESLKTAGLARDEIWGFLLYDVFQYKNSSYFDLWEMGKDYPDTKNSRLHVFIRQNDVTREVCTYRIGK